MSVPAQSSSVTPHDWAVQLEMWAVVQEMNWNCSAYFELCWAELWYDRNDKISLITDDDRLIMPDGGYIKLSDLESFYANAESVKASPTDAAKYAQFVQFQH